MIFGLLVIATLAPYPQPIRLLETVAGLALELSRVLVLLLRIVMRFCAYGHARRLISTIAAHILQWISVDDCWIISE